LLLFLLLEDGRQALMAERSWLFFHFLLFFFLLLLEDGRQALMAERSWLFFHFLLFFFLRILKDGRQALIVERSWLFFLLLVIYSILNIIKVDINLFIDRLSSDFLNNGSL
jgi:hypothetical protein